MSDRKFGVSSGGSSLIDHYEPHIVTAQDYYPFGMLSRVALPSGNKSYKFGFNGKLNDNDVKGGLGNQQDYGFRIYDPRIGKFLSVDPLTKDYPWYTPYQFAGNSPIMAIDVDGAEPLSRVTGPPITSYWDWNKNTDYNSQEAYSNGFYNYGKYYQKSMDDDRIYMLIEGVFVRINQIGLFPNQIENFEYYNTDKAKYEQFFPVDHIQPAQIMSESYKNWGEFGELAQRAVWSTAVFMTTSGIGSSGIFGTGLAGRFLSGVVEDVTAQMLTNGMDVTKINITAIPANLLPAIKSNIFTLGAKNIIASAFEASGEGYKGVGSKDFNVSNAIKSVAIGTLIDYGFDKIRNIDISIDRPRYTQARSLSYKPTYSIKYNNMNTAIGKNVMYRNLSAPTGAATAVGVGSNTIQEKAKD